MKLIIVSCYYIPNLDGFPWKSTLDSDLHVKVQVLLIDKSDLLTTSVTISSTSGFLKIFNKLSSLHLIFWKSKATVWCQLEDREISGQNRLVFRNKCSSRSTVFTRILLLVIISGIRVPTFRDVIRKDVAIYSNALKRKFGSHFVCLFCCLFLKIDGMLIQLDVKSVLLQSCVFI